MFEIRNVVSCSKAQDWVAVPCGFRIVNQKADRYDLSISRRKTIVKHTLADKNTPRCIL